MKKIMLLVLLAILALPTAVFAAGDVIRVVPAGSLDGTMAIITSSPADLEISVTSGQQPRTNIWLLFVIDIDTYNGLGTITIGGTDGPTTLSKSDFTGVPSNNKIPKTNDDNYVGNGHIYPGCTQQTQYNVNAIKTQMSQVYPTTSIRYVLVYGFSSINTSPKSFTVEVDSSHVNLLILAQGRAGSLPTDPLDSNSPFSGSSLVVPELVPILLSLASFSALALYAVKRRILK
jgi:hypothetical protein